MRKEEKRIPSPDGPGHSTPPGLGRRRIYRKEMPKPPVHEEAPESEAEDEPEGELTCVRCCTKPMQIAWNQAEARLIHVSSIGLGDRAGNPRICGGQVVRKGDEWRSAFAPGIVVPCYHAGASVNAHLVRLGRPALTGGPSWTGTALCGKTNQGRNRNWRPLYPAAAEHAHICQECKEAHLAETGRLTP